MALLIKANFFLNELKGLGYTNVDFSNVNVKPVQLRDASYSIPDFIDIGYSLKQINRIGFYKNNFISAGYYASNLKTAEYTFMDLYVQQFTLSDIRDANYTIADFSNNGFGLSQIKNIGFTATDFSNANISINNLINARYSLSDLLNSQYTLTQLNIDVFKQTDFSNANVTVSQLRDASYSISDLYGAGYNLYQISTAGYTKDDYLDNNITINQLQAAGTTVSILSNAGYTLSQMNISPGFMNTGFNAADIQISQLVSAGFSIIDLLNNGYVISQLNNVGLTKTNFIAAEYTISQLIDAGFSQTDLSTAGYVQSDLSPYFYYGPVYTPIVDPSMIVSYTMDSSSNGTITNYAGGIAYSYGTLIGGASVSRNVPIINGNGALTLTNTNSSSAYSMTQYAYLGDTITTNTSMTISIWFQTTGVAENIQTLFDIPYSNDARGISLNVSGTNQLIQQNLLPITSVSGEYVFMNPKIMYTFDRSFNNRTPNVVNWAYDASMVGGARITTTLNNYVIGNGAMTVLNTGNAYGNTTTNSVSQCIISNPSPVTLTNNASFSIWFNGTSTAGKLLSLFDAVNTTYGTKGISVDISGNQILSAFA